MDKEIRLLTSYIPRNEYLIHELSGATIPRVEIDDNHQITLHPGHL